MREPNAIARVALIAAAAATVAIAAVIVVLNLASGERDRELRQWQSRLGMVAETRARAVDDWLEGQFAELAGLAENASLQLYMTELAAGGGERASRGLAQSGYLANLLTLVAERAGFSARMTGPDVPANVRRVGVAGIVLVDMTGRTVAASPGAPPIEGRLRDFLRETPRGQRGLLDLHRGSAGSPTMGFAAPVFAVQGERSPARQIGWVVAIKEVASELFPRLRQPGMIWQSAEAVLVRRRGATVEFLSPGLDGAAPLSRTMAFDTPGLAASFAIDNVGGFATRRDYRDEEVLVTSRSLAHAPWTVVYKVDSAEALGPSVARTSGYVIRSLLIVAGLMIAFVAVWRHGASRRSARAAAGFEDMARRHQAQQRFLRLITDAQPGPMFIVDRDNRYRFANLAAAAAAGIADTDMIGKSLASVIGPAAAERHENPTREALASGEVVTEIHRTGSGDDLRVIRGEYIPIAESADLDAGVMVVEQDITAAVAEKERHGRTLDRLVSTLLTLVDRRDPYAANHSAQVATVARAIADEMGLDEATIETAATAGSIMNIGKILVPLDVLTRPGSLDDDELQQVRHSIQASADLLEGVEFDGPVVETLRQIHERWDGGGGPKGLAGDEILVSARIVSLANAFVAMISPRAYRAGASFDVAIERVMADSGAAFDRRAVTALVNRLDNRDARSQWREFGDPKVAA